MVRYECKEVRYEGDWLAVNSTSPETLRVVADQVKKLAPGCREMISDLHLPMPDGRRFYLLMHKVNHKRPGLRPKGYAATCAWSVLNLLCGRGWEPFGCFESSASLEKALFLRRQLEA